MNDKVKDILSRSDRFGSAKDVNALLSFRDGDRVYYSSKADLIGMITGKNILSSQFTNLEKYDDTDLYLYDLFELSDFGKSCLEIPDTPSYNPRVCIFGYRNMFDYDISTYSVLFAMPGYDSENSKDLKWNFKMIISKPMAVRKIHILSDKEDVRNIGFQLIANDGTIINPSSVNSSQMIEDKYLYEVNFTNSKDIMYIIVGFTNVTVSGAKIYEFIVEGEPLKVSLSTYGAAKVQLEDSGENIINPSTEEKQEDIYNAIRGISSLTYEDVYVFTEHGTEITNKENMFDKNISTYATVQLPESGELGALFSKPIAAKSIVIVSSTEVEWNNISYSIDYVDGTKDTGDVININDVGGYIPTNPSKFVISFSIKNKASTTYTFLVNEILISNVSIVSGRVSLENSNKEVINPATEDTLSSLKNDFNDKIPSPLSFDANGNLKVYMENTTIAYDSNADLFKESIERDNVGLAKDSTLSSTLPRNITEISGKALTPADWSSLLAFIPAIGMVIQNENIVTHSYNGDVFIANDYENGIANNDYVYYLIDATQIGNDKNMLVKFIDIHAEGDLLVQIYQNPDITDAGENMSVFNAKDDSNVSPNAKVTKYPSWNDMGTLIETIYIAGNGNYAFPTKIFENRFITKKYLIAIQNVSGNNLQHITFSMKFIEADFEINVAEFLNVP